MSENHQAQADLQDQKPVVDPLDATDSTNSGTNNPISDYEAELAAVTSGELEDEPQGGEPEGSDEESSASDEQDGGEEPTDDGQEDDGEGQPEVKTRDRFRFKDPADQAVAAIAKAKGISLIEAARIYAGDNPTERQAQNQNDAQTDGSEPRETVATVTSKIEELRAKKREANAALDFDLANELDAEIDTLRDKRDELRVSEVQEQSRAKQDAEAQYYAKYAESEAQTVRFYPDAASPESALSKEMARLEALMKKLDDPVYFSPDKPFILAREAAKNLGVPMTDPGRTPSQKKPATNRPMQPASGTARTSATAPTARLDDAIDGIGSINDYEKFVERLAAKA